MADDFQEDIRQLLRARFPLLYIQTSEESRLLDVLARTIGDTRAVRARDIWLWTVTNGLAQLGREGRPDTQDPKAALLAAAKVDLPAVVIFLDLHPWLGTANQPADPQLVRQLRDLAQLYRDGSQPRMLVLVSPVLRIPVELETVVTVVDFPLPDQEQIAALLQKMTDANASTTVTVDVDEAGLENMASAALGLTLAEAENAFARAMANDNRLDASDDLGGAQREAADHPPVRGPRGDRLEPVAGRHRRPGEPEEVAGEADRCVVVGGGALRAAGAEGCARHGRTRVRQIDDRQGDGVGLVDPADPARHRAGVRRTGRRVGGEHAQGDGHRRGDRALRAVDRRDREGLLLGHRRA